MTQKDFTHRVLGYLGGDTKDLCRSANPLVLVLFQASLSHNLALRRRSFAPPARLGGLACLLALSPSCTAGRLGLSPHCVPYALSHMAGARREWFPLFYFSLALLSAA